MGSRRAVLWWFGEINFWIWKMHPKRFGMPTKRKQLEHSPVNVVARKGAKNVVGRIWPKLIYNYSKCECFFFSLWTSPYLDLSTRPTINSVRISSKKKCPENYQQVDSPYYLNRHGRKVLLARILLVVPRLRNLSFQPTSNSRECLFAKFSIWRPTEPCHPVIFLNQQAQTQFLSHEPMSIAFTEASDSIISTPCIQSPAAMYVGSQPVPRKCFDSEPQILPESAKKVAPLIN